jgi:TRAP transporter TatT component family protein
MKKTLFLITFISLVLTTGCSMKKITTNTIADVATNGMEALEGETDIEFAREASPALIKTLEVLRYGNLKNARMLTVLSLSYAQYTFGFVEEDVLRAREDSAESSTALARAEDFYRRGREYGIAALSRKSHMHKGFQSSFKEFARSVKRLGKKDVPALFWTAFNWASWVNLNRADPMAIIDMPRIEAMIDRVIELDSGFYYGSAHAFKAIIAISRPRMLGGNPDLAKAEFEKAISIEPDYLMTKVLYAQYYARGVQDKKLFRRLLNEVIEASGEELKEQALANGLAKRRAELLLKMERKLF